ncbi:MAG: type II methionyl aminopeptidase [Halobacteria archaeon]|nr:type II methionyl aminopeptidase [Halobacteria archaeon]
MDSEPDYEKHREAGEILSEVREEAASTVEVGASLLEVAETAEEAIRDAGAKPAFPVNISRDEEAAHATPSRDDDETFGEEMVNLDIGVHVDGWIADSAVTVDLSGNDELAQASRDALDAALDTVEAGVSTAEIGRVIEETVKGHGYNPVYNLTGHGLGEYTQHTSPNIPNRGVDKGVELEEGMVVAIEPFATDGSGKVEEGSSKEIFSLNQTDPRVRSRRARELVETVQEEYRTLPFAKRWLPDDRLDMNLRKLESSDVVHGYPVLKEDEGNLVSQAEHTVIVEEDGCEITTL